MTRKNAIVSRRSVISIENRSPHAATSGDLPSPSHVNAAPSRRLGRPAPRAAVLVSLFFAVTHLAAATSAQTYPRVLLRSDLGDIVVEIYETAAPATAANFLTHVDQELFTGAHFYRVVRMNNQPDNEVKIEVIQGGLGFDADSSTPPIAHETTRDTGIHHLDGVLSMARLEPGTASSEFFICVGDQPELDFAGARNSDGQGFAAFGRVVEGMDVVKAIHRREADGQMLLEPVEISTVRRLP